MLVADIRTTILAEASNGVLGSNKKLAGDDVSNLVLPSDHHVGGLSGDAGPDVFDSHQVDPR